MGGTEKFYWAQCGTKILRSVLNWGLKIHIFIYLFIYLFVYLFVYLFICLFILKIHRV